MTNAFSTSPTGSSILAQGNALGNPAQESTQPEGLPHHPAKRYPTHMKQAFSLPSIFHLLPQSVAWASMPEALGLQIRPLTPGSDPSSIHQSKINNQQS